MTIYLGGQLIVQPSILTERLVQIESENESIGGSIQRNRIGQKKEAELKWSWLAPSGYQQLVSLFTTGSGFWYSNDQSNYAGGVLTFSGLAFFDEGEYVPGASLFRDFKARIREI